MVLDIKNFVTWVRSFLDDVYALKSEIPSGVILDNTVTQNSSNAVKSSGIYTALSGKSNTGHGHTTSDISDWLNKVYPVGSIYMSASDVNPSTLFGGTWVQIEDRFLLASGSTYSATYDSNGFANKTDGEATHTLTKDEMPSHTHTQNEHNHTQNQHRHSLGSDWSSGSGSQGAFAYASNHSRTTKYTGYETPTNKPTTATNQNTGGGQAHNNMPPYLVVNIWKRTA